MANKADYVRSSTCVFWTTIILLITKKIIILIIKSLINKLNRRNVSIFEHLKTESLSSIHECWSLEYSVYRTLQHIGYGDGAPIGHGGTHHYHGAFDVAKLWAHTEYLLALLTSAWHRGEDYAALGAPVRNHVFKVYVRRRHGRSVHRKRLRRDHSWWLDDQWRRDARRHFVGGTVHQLQSASKVLWEKWMEWMRMF